MSEEQPFVSFCLKFYNQLEFVDEALDGAFSQTYPNLEIVISDDCSTDGTDVRVKERISQYKASGGRIPVIYNHNSLNLGNVKNFEKCASLAHGELIVQADGDDVSLPERTSVIVAKWLKFNKKAYYIIHSGNKIDINGKVLGKIAGGHNASHPMGCCSAYRRETVTHFALVSKTDAYDDAVFGSRAKMLGDELVLDDKLILYRVGAGNTSSSRNLRRLQIKLFKGICVSTDQSLIDLEYIREKIGSLRYGELKDFFLSKKRLYERSLVLYEGASFLPRLKAYVKTKRAPTVSGRIVQALCLLPLGVTDILYGFYGKVRGHK